jgi:hypothetical protein
LSCCLLPVPVCHSPQTLKHGFFTKSQVVQTTVNGVFDFTLGVLVSSYQFELCSLQGGSATVISSSGIWVVLPMRLDQ